MQNWMWNFKQSVRLSSIILKNTEIVYKVFGWTHHVT